VDILELEQRDLAVAVARAHAWLPRYASMTRGF